MSSTAGSSAPARPPSRTQAAREPDAAPGYRPAGPAAASRGRIGWVLAGSWAVGLLAAVLLVAAPVVPPTEAGVTGAVLCGGAVGWAMLAVLSGRLTDQPQPWAAAPALLMGSSGLLLVTVGPSAREPLAWLWPPTLLVLVAWMVVRARRTLHSRSRRWLLYPVLTALALAAVGGGYGTVRDAVGARADAMPGQRIDVGGHRLHLSCAGSGGPTVVLEPGAGMMSAHLEHIAPAVARDTRVCVYDRAGRGWSEPSETPQDARRIATDLHTLLDRADVPGPYVLAGHSFGGLYALTFAAQYPDEVAGMVLIDSTAPASAPGAGAAPPLDSGPDDLTRRLSGLAAAAGRLGLAHLIGVPTSDHLRSTIDEYAHGSASMAQAASVRDLGDTPLTVLTAGAGTDPAWSVQQDALATLSTDAVHRVVEGVDHAGLIVDEAGAAETTRAILDVVSRVRTADPTAG